MSKHLPIVEVSTSNKTVALSISVADNLRKRPKKVLDEETYAENVERIIVRDFFPDHEHLKDQKEYLEAEEKKDFEKMRQIALKFAAAGSRGATPSSLKFTPLPSPASFETPLQNLKHPGSEETRPKKQTRADSIDARSEEHHFGYRKKEKISVEEENIKEIDKGIGLDKFLSKYTSEDNDSFESIMEKSEQAKRTKHDWLYEAEKRHAETAKEILQLQDAEQPLAITDGTEQSTSDSSTKNGGRATVPVNTWEYKNKNSLMYYPEGMGKSEDDAVFKKPLLIKHELTRFKDDPFRNTSVRSKLAQKMSENKTTGAEKVGPDGKSVIPQESPRVGDYGFVATPSPMPGVDDSPLMTWGEIDSTPARLEATFTPGPAFRFPEESERERLTHKMVDANTKKHRAKRAAALKQMKASVLGTPNRIGSIMSTERINLLSPAAKRLVNKRFHLGTDKSLKASYTPTPSQRRLGTGSETPVAKTPTHRKTPKNTPTRGRSNITDNLLNIPGKRRKSAADFF